MGNARRGRPRGPRRQPVLSAVLIAVGAAAVAAVTAVTAGLVPDVRVAARISLLCGFLGGAAMAMVLLVLARRDDSERAAAWRESAPGDRAALREVVRHQSRNVEGRHVFLTGLLLGASFVYPATAGELAVAGAGLALSIVALFGCYSVWWLRGGYERSATAYARHRAAYAITDDLRRDA